MCDMLGNVFEAWVNNKKELATRFYVDGRECITSARILFEDKKRGSRSKYDILLIHGIELLLKSYLLFKNATLPDNREDIDKYLKRLGHRYYLIYKECIKYGDELNSLNLKVHLDSLGHLCYPDSIGVRYIQDSGLVMVDPAIFSAIRAELIKPLYRMQFPRSTSNDPNL